MTGSTQKPTSHPKILVDLFPQERLQNVVFYKTVRVRMWRCRVAVYDGRLLDSKAEQVTKSHATHKVLGPLISCWVREAFVSKQQLASLTAKKKKIIKN